MRTPYLILTLFLTQALPAQDIRKPSLRKPLYAGVHFSADHSFRHLSNADGQSSTAAIINLRNRIEKARPGYTAGVSLGKRISSRFTVETGLFYSDKGYQTGKEILVYIPPSSSTDPVWAKFIYKQRFLDIPVRIVYQAGKKKLQFISSGGFIVNILLKEKQTVFKYYESGRVEKENMSTQTEFRTINVSAELGAGVLYTVNKKIKLSAEPLFRYSLFRSVDKPVSEHLWNAGINLSVSYRIW